VKFIGDEAFRGNRLSTISLPDSVDIGENAFTGNSLTTITIGNNVISKSNSFPYNFFAYYQEKGRRSGTYVYRENQWYTNQEWNNIVNARNTIKEEKPAPPPPPREPNYQIGLMLNDNLEIFNGSVNNWLTATPWYSLKLGSNANFKISANITFPWNELTEWQEPLFELAETSFTFNFWDENWFEMGRIYYRDPLGYIVAGGLFDGIQTSFLSSKIQLGAFYSGLINKRTANIMMSVEDAYDYFDENNQYAPKRFIGSFQWRIGDYDFYLLLGALAQLDMREDFLPFNTQYLLAKIHVGDSDFSMDIGAAVNSISEAEDPDKVGMAASIDLSFWWSYTSRFSIGLWWFSGLKDEDTRVFKPITNYQRGQFINAFQPPLWLPQLSFYTRINDYARLEINAGYYIWETEDEDSLEKSEFKVDLTVNISLPSFPGSSSSNKSKFSGVKWGIPLYFGFYAHALGVKEETEMDTMAVLGSMWFIGAPLQLGVEIDFGNIVSLALLAEAGAGTYLFYFLEYNIGGMAELYFADKKIGVGLGFGQYGNMIPFADSEEENGNKLSYTRFELLFRTDNDSKFGLFVQKYNNNVLGFGIHILFGSDLLR